MFNSKSTASFVIALTCTLKSYGVVHSESGLKEKYHPSSCRIAIISADESEVSGGSGTLVRPNQILTAGHVPDSLRKGDWLKVECGYQGLVKEKIDIRPSPSGKPYLYGGPTFSESAKVVHVKNQRRLGRDVAVLTLDHDLKIPTMSVYGDKGEPTLQIEQLQKVIASGSCWMAGYGTELYEFHKETMAGGLGFHTLKSETLTEVPYDPQSEWSALDLLEIQLPMPVTDEKEAGDLIKFAKSIVTHETGVGETDLDYSTAMRSFDALSTKISLQQKSSYYAAGDSGSGVICDFKQPSLVGVVKGVYSWPLKAAGEMVKGTMIYSERFTLIDAKSSIFLE